jgi:hypothetical protein
VLSCILRGSNTNDTAAERRRYDIITAWTVIGPTIDSE